MLFYAITQRALLAGSEAERRSALVTLARRWAQLGVDYVQVREKDLSAPDLLALAQEIVAAVRGTGAPTRVLLNGPAEIALAAGADGVHLPSDASVEAAEQASDLFTRAGKRAVLSHACHALEDVRAASAGSPDGTLILYAPVFEKITAEGRIPGCGLEALRRAVEAAGRVPVFALGGVTMENAAACVAAGAAGIAGIRLFLEDFG